MAIIGDPPPVYYDQLGRHLVPSPLPPNIVPDRQYKTYPSSNVTSIDCIQYHDVQAVTEYPDGIFGNCVVCGSRVKIASVPGGYASLTIKDFLERVVMSSEEEDGELLAELARLSTILQSEQDELDLAKNRMEVAETVLQERSIV